MAVMLRLEESPSFGGSSRELRELLVTAVYAAEKDPSARHMKVMARGTDVCSPHAL